VLTLQGIFQPVSLPILAASGRYRGGHMILYSVLSKQDTKQDTKL